MIGIDLFTLNSVELRRLSKAARARGDGLLADRVDWEIATRADHSLPVLTPRPIAPGAGLGGFEVDEMDPQPPAFTPDHYEPPEGARGGWRSVSLVILGAVVGSAVTGGGFWAAGALARREPAPRADVVRSAAPPVEALAEREVPVAAPALGAEPVAKTAEVHPPNAARAVRRTAKARPAPVEDPDRLARLYESGVRELDAARTRKEEPIY